MFSNGRISFVAGSSHDSQEGGQGRRRRRDAARVRPGRHLAANARRRCERQRRRRQKTGARQEEANVVGGRRLQASASPASSCWTTNGAPLAASRAAGCRLTHVTGYSDRRLLQAAGGFRSKHTILTQGTGCSLSSSRVVCVFVVLVSSPASASRVRAVCLTKGNCAVSCQENRGQIDGKCC